MHKRLFLITFMFSLKLMAYQGTVLLLDSSKQLVLGSASRVCIGLFSEKVHFITAAHVVEGVSELTGMIDSQGTTFKMKKLNVNSELDLALLVTEARLVDSLIPCHSMPPLFYQDNYPRAFDVLAIKNEPSLYQFEIEGYDSELRSIRSEKIEAPIIKTIQKGFPGRDGLNELLMTTFVAKPGFSGGLVVGPTVLGGVNRRFVIGIVIAADTELNRVVMVPASTISQWLFSLNSNKEWTETRKVEESRVLNLSLDLAMNIPNIGMKSVGLLSFGGVGTGRPAVGSPLIENDSGIKLNKSINKSWLSIGDKWVEGEPLNDATKQWIKKHLEGGLTLEGISKSETGQWSKTSKSPFPQVLRINEMAKWLEAQPTEGCIKVQFKNIKTAKLMPVVLCERISDQEGFYQISSDAFNILSRLSSSGFDKITVQASVNRTQVEITSLRRIENSSFKVKLEGLSGIEVRDLGTGDWWVGPVK